MPYFLHEDGRVRLNYGEGHWSVGRHFKQRFDPSSPLPKQNGWEIDSTHSTLLPVPRVRPSWEHELLFEGRVYRQEDGPGPGGRGRFRCTEAGRTDWTVEWAEADTATAAG